jgi:hypothetical protein
MYSLARYLVGGHLCKKLPVCGYVCVPELPGGPAARSGAFAQPRETGRRFPLEFVHCARVREMRSSRVAPGTRRHALPVLLQPSAGSCARQKREGSDAAKVGFPTPSVPDYRAGRQHATGRTWPVLGPARSRARRGTPVAGESRHGFLDGLRAAGHRPQPQVPRSGCRGRCPLLSALSVPRLHRPIVTPALRFTITCTATVFSSVSMPHARRSPS